VLIPNNYIVPDQNRRRCFKVKVAANFHYSSHPDSGRGGGDKVPGQSSPDPFHRYIKCRRRGTYDSTDPKSWTIKNKQTEIKLKVKVIVGLVAYALSSLSTTGVLKP
jgi:hypothetical protein